MKTSLRRFRQGLSFVLSWSLAMAPWAGLPIGSYVHAQAADESDLSQGFRLNTDLDALLDRAAYPDIPRRGASGRPSAQELADASLRLQHLRDDLRRTYLSRIVQAGDEQAEIDSLKEIDLYFESAVKLEGVRNVLGQGTDPADWNQEYGLQIPLQDLAQLRFVEWSSFFGRHFIGLPVDNYGKDLTRFQSLNPGAAAFVTSLESVGGQWLLNFRFNLDKVAVYDRLRLLSTPSLKSGLQYAALFSAERLYDSLAMTQILQGVSPQRLSSPPDAIQRRWPSLRVARDGQVKAYQTEVDALQKPKAFKALLDAVDAANSSGRGWALDDGFYAAFDQIIGVSSPKPSTPDEVNARHADERSSLTIALSSLLNLTDLDSSPELAAQLLLQSKRLALRWTFLGNADIVAHVSASARPALEKLIDDRAQGFTSDVLQSTPTLPQALSAIAQNGPDEFLRKARESFATNLQKTSLSLRDFDKQDINLQYLFSMQSGGIEALAPSSLVQTVLQNVKQQPNYAAGYQKFREMLLTYVQGFRFTGPLPRKLTVSALTELAPGARWNPDAIADQVPAKYLPDMNPVSQDWLSRLWHWRDARPPGAREKDLSDLLTIAHLLKFNVYEFLNGQRPTTETLGFDKSVTGRWLQGEHKAYQREMKKDLADNAPLLASPVDGRQLWEVLANSPQSASANLSVIDPQLRAVEAQIHANENSLIQDIAQVDAVHGEDISGLGNEIRTLTTRASQISLSLESSASFNSFYQRMRQQLMMPGFVQSQWEQLSSFANSVNNYILLYMAVNAVASLYIPAGRISGTLGRMLTPIFGVGFSRLNYLIWGLLGVSVSGDAVKAYTEHSHIATLRDYAACGSAHACVALYSDVQRQSDLAMAPVYQAAITVATIVVFVFGLRGLGKFYGKIAQSLGRNGFAAVESDRAILGLNSTAAFDEGILRQGLDSALKKAAQQSDPIARELGSTYARQAYYRLQSGLWTATRTWAQRADAVTRDLQSLGLTRANWTDPNALNSALTRLEFEYGAGRLLTFDYLERKSALVSLSQQLAPVWQQMAKSDTVARYYEQVWARAEGMPASAARGAGRYYEERLAPAFSRAMDELYGDTVFRPKFQNGRLIWRQSRVVNGEAQMDKVLERLTQDLESNPELARQRALRLQAAGAEVQP